MINSNFTLKTLALACCILSGAAFAAPPANPGGGGGNQDPMNLVNQKTCTVADMQLTYYRALEPANSSPVTVGPINAYGCYGMVSGNNSNFDNPDQNLGYDGDGWFNSPSGIWPNLPGAFITAADLQDLEDNNIDDPDDPGWVYMGKDEGPVDVDKDGDIDFYGFQGASIPDPDPLDPENQGYKFVDDLFSCSASLNGTYGSCINYTSAFWKFTPPSTQPDILFDLLGGTFFDQVAVVFKGGNGFVMYNFTLSQLGLDPILAGDTKYEFGGYFNLSGALINNGGNTPGLSNISLWARDPFSPNDVAEPGYLALLGLALLALYRRRRLQ